jgi:hypothetical protein
MEINMNRRLKEKLESNLVEFYVQSNQIPLTLSQQANHLLIDNDNEPLTDNLSQAQEQK